MEDSVATAGAAEDHAGLVQTSAAPADTDRASDPPRVSVLMATHNAAPYLRQAILSILGQTFADFELIVVDDASTDATASILAGIADPRLRAITTPRNVGAVLARNQGFALARGEYLAIQDADDISQPTRLARQVAHLDRNPGDVLVAGDMRQMHPAGEMIRPRSGGPASPLLLEWMLHLGNPISFSSVTMRISALRRLPEFLRESHRYAEDYDLFARLRAHGGLFRLPQSLLVYRVHPDSCSARNRARMFEQTARVLQDIWARDLAGEDAGQAAVGLIARHISSGEPVENARTLRAVRDALSRLTDAFLDDHPDCTPAERDAVISHAIRCWEALVHTTLRAGRLGWWSVPFFRVATSARLRHRDLLGATLRGIVPDRLVDMLRPGAKSQAEPLPAPATSSGWPMVPPALFVAVTLEGSAGAPVSFDLRAQDIFDLYGLRPAYLLDESLAAQAPVCLALRRVHDAGGCGIGAWWREDTDQARIEALLDAVAAGCGVAPAYTTIEAASASPVPAGRADPVGALAAIPLSRGMIVPLAPALNSAGGVAMSQSDAAWAALPDRGDLAHPVALLPGQIASAPQIILLRSLLARGERRFFLRLHLRQGDAGGTEALDRLARVCAWFFEDLGGLPGDIRTLAADRRRRPRAGGAAARQGFG